MQNMLHVLMDLVVAPNRHDCTQAPIGLGLINLYSVHRTAQHEVLRWNGLKSFSRRLPGCISMSFCSIKSRHRRA